MRTSRFTEEQIISILREREIGVATGDVCRKHGINSATCCKWKDRSAPCCRLGHAHRHCRTGGALSLISSLTWPSPGYASQS